MNEAEQLAYFAASGNKLEFALERHSRDIRNLARKIDSLRARQDYAAQTVAIMADRLDERVHLHRQ